MPPAANRSLHPCALAWSETHRGLLTRIERAAEDVRHGCCTHPMITAIADYFDNEEVKAAAIDEISHRNKWAFDSEPLFAARSLNLRALPRRVRNGRWYWKAKNNRGYRLVCSLSGPLRVAQRLAKDVALRVHRPADHIGDWRGRGPVYHLSSVFAELENGSIVLLADVQNCFASVQPDAVYRLGLLPSDLVEACFDSRRIRLRAPHRGYTAAIGSTFDRTGRNGLLSGGSASSLLWAMMIDDMPGALPAGVRAHTYVDNIIIVCRTTQECGDAEAALIRYFTEHPAGPFFLTTTRANLESGFDHLGYNITARGGRVEVGIKDSKLPMIDSRMRNMFAESPGVISKGECDRMALELLSPWPMLSVASRAAMVDVIRAECALHNAPPVES